MKKETMVINGVEFEVRHKAMTWSELDEIACSTKTLAECYSNPSVAKRDIYRKLMAWADGVDKLFYFGVYRYNTFMFTMTGIIENADVGYTGDIVIYITPTHNIAYIVK